MSKYFKDVAAIWKDGLAFDVSAGSGFAVRVDGNLATGFSPMEMVLVGLAGCTGGDVIDILRKMRQAVTGLEVKVHGDRAEDHPRRFTDIRVTFIVTGQGVEPEVVRRAIELSQTKYCSVAATLGGVAHIATDFEIREAEPTPV